MGTATPSASAVVSGPIHGSSVPRSSQSLSMFNPMTAFESESCLTRLKPRSIGSSCGSAVRSERFSPCCIAEKP